MSTAAEAAILQDLGQQPIQWKAAAAMSPGEVVATPSGVLGVVAGLNSIATNEKVAAHIGGVIDVKAKSTDTPAIGDDIYWDDTANEATVTTTNNTFLGETHKAKASGETRMEVLLNQGALP